MDAGFLAESSLVVVVAVFVASSALVWFAGTRLSRYADRIAELTGLGHVVVGTLLLATVTSLPEVATTITASVRNKPDIAVNNLLGGVAFQTTLLVLGDVLVGRRSLTSMVESPPIGLHAIATILLLSTTAGVIVIEDPGVFHIGLGSIVIALFFAAAYLLTAYFESIQWWASPADDRDGIRSVKASVSKQSGTAEGQQEQKDVKSFAEILRSKLSLFFVLAALAVLTGGYMLVMSGEAIATQTGLGESLVGAILIALATSLPELSTTVEAVRLKQYTLAFTNIFGTNVLTVGLIFLADVCYGEGPILNKADSFSVFASMLGIAVTTIYMIGLSMRLKKSFLNLGYDSWLVLLTYLSGVTILFTMFEQ